MGGSTEQGSRRVPELVIFDLDGTLVDSEPASLGAWIRAGKEFGLTMSKNEIGQFVGRNTQAIAALAHQLYGNDLPFQEIYQRKVEISEAELRKGIPLKRGALEILNKLDQRSIRRCIATSSSRERAAVLLETNGLTGFEFIMTGEDIAESKPHPEIFLKSLERADVAANRAMIIEDSKNGIMAARRSGAVTVLIPDVLEVDEEMKQQADHMFRSLLELKDYIGNLN